MYYVIYFYKVLIKPLHTQRGHCSEYITDSFNSSVLWR